MWTWKLRSSLLVIRRAKTGLRQLAADRPNIGAVPGHEAAGSGKETRNDVTAVGATKLLLTPIEAAEQLAVSRTKVYELMAAGMLRSIHIGRLRRVPVDALRDFIGDMESR